VLDVLSPLSAFRTGPVQIEVFVEVGFFPLLYSTDEARTSEIYILSLWIEGFESRINVVPRSGKTFIPTAFPVVTAETRRLRRGFSLPAGTAGGVLHPPDQKGP